ncbi:unnamed protein product, partial [marine sediment metagenome]
MVGDVGDGIEAVARTVQLHPDVVLMDVVMPKMNGMAATRRIRRESPSVKILALTMYETEQYVREMLRAGASGYVSKRATARELIAAIQAAYQGNTFLHPSVAKDIVAEYLEQIKVEAKEGKRKRLTNRELDVLSLVAEGKTNKVWSSTMSTRILAINMPPSHKSLSEHRHVHRSHVLAPYLFLEFLHRVLPSPSS